MRAGIYLILTAFLLAVVVSFSDIASAAQSVRVMYAPPDTREGGASITATEIAGYDVRYVGLITPETIINTTRTRVDIATLQPDTYTFSVRAIDTAGLISSWSDPVSVTVNAPPSAPVGVSVTITVTVSQ